MALEVRVGLELMPEDQIPTEEMVLNGQQPDQEAAAGVLVVALGIKVEQVVIMVAEVAVMGITRTRAELEPPGLLLSLIPPWSQSRLSIASELLRAKRSREFFRRLTVQQRRRNLQHILIFQHRYSLTCATRPQT